MNRGSGDGLGRIRGRDDASMRPRFMNRGSKDLFRNCTMVVDSLQ